MPVSRRPLLVALGLLILPSCSNDSNTALAIAVSTTTTAAATTTTTSAPTTTLAATTTTAAPTTTAATTTTAAPTTTLAPTTVETLPAQLPLPAAPPPPRSKEQYIELGSIEIPKIGIVKRMLEGISLNTLDLGPGHWPGTAMPGQVGNVVVAGHRTSHDKPFRNIDQLAPGDEVIFNTADGRFVYLVTGTSIVKPEAVYIINQTPEKTATLFACHPVGSTRERIVVHLVLAEPTA